MFNLLSGIRFGPIYGTFISVLLRVRSQIWDLECSVTWHNCQIQIVLSRVGWRWARVNRTVAAVCHVTNMTRRHGNIKRECYKITVALKKNNNKTWIHLWHGPQKLSSQRQQRDTIAEWISLLFFLQIAKWHFYIFSIFEISTNFDTAALLFSLFFLFHASYYDTAALLFSLFLNFLLFYVYSLYFRYNLLLWYYLVVQ